MNDSNSSSNSNDKKYTDVEKSRIERLGKGWFDQLSSTLNHPDIQKASTIVGEERNKYIIYPPRDKTFRAYKLTPFEEVKVVILGQDPYHNGFADGLAFSSDNDKRIVPESLKMVFKAMAKELNTVENKVPNLEGWAEQGVLLLNTSLTVRAGQVGSHSDIGWESLIIASLKVLATRIEPVCYMLWGTKAKSFKRHITNPGHLVIEAEHPAAPLHRNSTVWNNNDCFSRCNAYLKAYNLKLIDWNYITPF